MKCDFVFFIKQICPFLTVIVLKIMYFTDYLVYAKALFISNFNHDATWLFFAVGHYTKMEESLCAAKCST